jgi:hypothetical protein
MKKEDKLIDNLFKEELGGYAETPPPMAWDALEKRLDTAPPRPTFFTRRSIYLMALSAVLVLSITVARKLTLPPSETNTGKIAAVDNAATPVPVKTNANLTPATLSITAQQPSAPTVNAGSQAPLSEAGKQNNNQTTVTTTNNSNNKSHKTISTAHKQGNAKHLPIAARMRRNNSASPMAMNGDDDRQQQSYQPDTYAASHSQNQDTEKLPDNEQAQSTADPDQTKQQESTDTQAQPDQHEAVEKPKGAEQIDNPKPRLNKKPKFNRIELGLKAGYESSVQQGVAQKFVASPYIQYNLTREFAIMLQPAIKQSTMPSHNIGSPVAYRKNNADSTVAAILDPIPVVLPLPDSMGALYYSLYHMHYSQSHDSISKRYTTSGRYTEYELPILLKYNVVKGFSVYAGANIVYSNTVGINEQTSTVKNIMVVDSSNYQLVPTGSAVPAPQFTVNQVIKSTGTDIANYKNPYPTPAGSSFRAGYMLGFSYEYKNRFLFDALMQQTPSASPNVKGGYDLNTTLTAPYFRFTIGYKLLK